MSIEPSQDTRLKKLQAKREAEWNFGQDTSASITDEATGLVEQAQVIQSEGASEKVQSATLRYDDALAEKLNQKLNQAEQIEERLERLIDQQSQQLALTQAHRPGRMSLPTTRARWQMQQQQQQASLQRLQGRLQVVREIREGVTTTGTPNLERLAREALKHESPELVAARDAEHQRQVAEKLLRETAGNKRAVEQSKASEKATEQRQQEEQLRDIVTFQKEAQSRARSHRHVIDR